MLQERGASFFADIARVTGHLQSQVEDALWELSAAGVVTADGFDNLRALLDPKRRQGREKSKDRDTERAGGRCLVADHVSEQSGGQAARQFLRRYGVVFRDLLARESVSPAWRDLLVQYRRMEFQGEIRGGRLWMDSSANSSRCPKPWRLCARCDGKGRNAARRRIKLSAVDPLNLIGIILPGARVPASPANYILFRDGVPIQSGETAPVENPQQPGVLNSFWGKTPWLVGPVRNGNLLARFQRASG